MLRVELGVAMKQFKLNILLILWSDNYVIVRNNSGFSDGFKNS